MELLVNTQHKEKNTIIIPDIVFNKMIQNATCDAGDVDDVVGFSSEHEDWSISFYGKADDDFYMIIEDFGVFSETISGGKTWQQLLPTANQLVEMQDKINDKAEELHQEKADEEEAQKEAIKFNKDPYDYYGVNRSMFI